MKKLTVTLAFLLVASLGNTFAQQQVVNTENNKIVTHVAGNFYDVVFVTEDGNILQEGHYIKVEDKFLKPHGIWKLYDSNTFALVTTASYDTGEQLWVETMVDGKPLRVDKMDLTVKRLQNKIVALEAVVTLANQ